MMGPDSKHSWDVEYTAGRLGGEDLTDYALLKFAHQVPKGPVLDLGGGDGRNALFFAQKAYDVKLIDGSQAAIQQCRKKVDGLKIKMEIEQHNIENYKIPPHRYTLIIASLLLQAFKFSIAKKIIDRMIQGVCSNGYIYVSVLSTDDSAFLKRKRELDPVEKNTFYLADRNIYSHHFTKTELLDCFPGFELVYFSESRFQRSGAYKDEFPYQATLEFLGRKTV